MLADPAKFKYIGKDTKIHEYARLIKEEMIEIGDGTQIDDFAFIFGGAGVKLGRYCHVCSFVSIIGGGELITGDYVGMAAGCRIITGSHQHGSGMRMVSNVPLEQQDICRGKIVLGRDVFIGSNAIIYPNITIGEGAMIGAGSLVTKDVEPWTINVGYPARVVGQRPVVPFD
jgi:acetyltransferase-like isoleucine patch superfamily enzyme